MCQNNIKNSPQMVSLDLFVDIYIDNVHFKPKYPYLQVAVVVLDEGSESRAGRGRQVDGGLLPPVRVNQRHHEPFKRRLHVRVKTIRLARPTYHNNTICRKLNT